LHPTVLQHLGLKNGRTSFCGQLQRAGEHIEVTIADDGRGFDSTSAVKELGLVSIAERAKIAGGSVDIVTAAAQGTRIHARIPAEARVNSDGKVA
jgi:signal transduction histidine kinase